MDEVPSKQDFCVHFSLDIRVGLQQLLVVQIFEFLKLLEKSVLIFYEIKITDDLSV